MTHPSSSAHASCSNAPCSGAPRSNASCSGASCSGASFALALLAGLASGACNGSAPTEPIPGPAPIARAVAYAERGVTVADVPTTADRSDERHEMVAATIAARGIADPRVLAAMRTVPRHWFVPEGVAAWAYVDRPLPIGSEQTISQPYIVALMTESVRLRPGERVLEVGTGSGYQAAVLAAITPHVYTIEIVEDLAAGARAAFKRHGYESIVARAGDGYRGWPEHAPFDAIIVTAAPEHVPPALFEQLAPGGRLCIPVGAEFATQELRLITKAPDGSRREQTIIPVRFVPMTGEARGGR